MIIGISCMDMNNVNLSQSSSGTQQAGASKKQEFEQTKSKAISAAHGNNSLLSKINGITPHKGAIQEMEALLLQATQSNATQPYQQQRTLGIG